MDPREELAALRRMAELEAKASGTQLPMTHATSSSSEDPSAPESIGAGLVSSMHKGSAGLTGMLPRVLENALVKAGVSPSQEMLDANKKRVEAGGPLAAGSEMVGDIAQQLLPAKKLEMVTKGLTVLPRTVANMAGYGGINAALNGKDRGQAALIGAGSSALGATMTRLMGGPLRTTTTPEAKRLMEAGVELTPGQMVTGAESGPIARSVRGLEDKAQSVPFLGDIIKERARTSGLTFNTTKINEALAPIGKKVEGTGDTALADAMEKISNSYDQVLPDISIPGGTALRTMRNGLNQVDKDLPLLGGPQYTKLQRFINARIVPYQNSGAPLTGAEAKALDSELGHYIRQYNKGGPENVELSEAFSILQRHWRDSFVGSTPEAKAALEAANTARANLEPLRKTIESSKTGDFSPQQLRQTLLKSDRKVDPLTESGLAVLPNTIPDSGTAGRALLGSLLASGAGAGAVASGNSLLMSSLLAGAGVGSAYTKPGAAYLQKGLSPLLTALRRGKTFDQDALEALTRQMTTQSVRAGLNQNFGE